MSERAEQLYEQARALGPAERAVFIAAECRDDAQLRAELESLLAESAAAESYFALLGDVVLRSVWSASRPDANLGRIIGHYQLTSHLGSGGMGVVYRAHDTKLERDVALKFLPFYMDQDARARERLLAEARAAAALEHPNVCTVHEIGETEDGRPFIAMGLCSGETLKQRLRRGPLPVDEVVSIAKQVASGLAAAHARGIVHRDIKPANIMLDREGTARILDFGLAQMSDVNITRPGTTPGTLAYMSPEQARGEAVDQRSDLWSLGVVLYEMLTGSRPFTGSNDRELLDAILHASPAPISVLRPETPVAVADAVNRLLGKEPQARFPGPAELSAAISGVPRHRKARRKPIGIALAVVLLAGAGAVGLLMNRIAGSPSSVDSREPAQAVIVADFANIGADSSLADAVSQAIRFDLGRSRRFRLTGSATVAGALERMRRPRDTRLDSEIAREVAVREGISAVINGEVRRIGSSFVVAASIVEAASGDAVGAWREVARDSTALIDAIDRLSEALRHRLGESLPALKKEAPLWRSTTASLPALRKHAEATRAFHQGDRAQAVALYEDAIRLDSSFIMAYVGLSIAGANNLPRRRLLEAYIKSYELRDRASETERHLVTASYFLHVVGDAPRAAESFRKQVETAKLAGEAPLHASLMHTLMRLGDFAAAEQVGWEARALRPTAANQSGLAITLYRRGKTQEADAILGEALERFPNHSFLPLLKVHRVAAGGSYATADSLAEAILQPLEDTPRYFYAVTAAVRGRIGEAIAHLQAQRQFLVTNNFRAEAIEAACAEGRLRVIAGDTAGALREVSDFINTVQLDSVDVHDRPYLAVARFYAEAGDARRARAYLSAYERMVPKQLQGADVWRQVRTRALLELAEGKVAAAVKSTDVARRLINVGAGLFDDDIILPNEHPEAARVYDRAGRRADAIAAYERYLSVRSLTRTDVDAFELAPALFRLAELYAVTGDRRAAGHYYRRFAQLWGGADPALQPQVRLARERADALAAAEPVRQPG